ncbi:hypothetical protein EF721_24030, partial [Salmonella enterica]|nr:hypothetical protein [Salmonella enterica]
MLDTRKAYIDLGDGKRLSAHSEIFLGTSSFRYDFPADESKRIVPLNNPINNSITHSNPPPK